MTPQRKTFLTDLPRFRDAAAQWLDTLLADLVMIGEIPAPTFHEERRAAFLAERFSLHGLVDVSTDETGNALAVLEGPKDAPAIAVVAHLDTLFPESVDHTVTVTRNAVEGPGVADNSLGLAVIACLPALLDSLDIRLSRHLILVGAAKGLGRGNLAGLRFFLANNKFDIEYGLCVEGVPLGRLSVSSIGMLRGDITCTVPEAYDWTRFGLANALVSLNEVISRLLEIRVPRKPRTSIVLGSIEGGTGYATMARNAVVRFEVRSESQEMVTDIRQQIEDIVADVNSHGGGEVSLDLFASRRPGGIGISHPLARTMRRVMERLDIPCRVVPSTSELSAFIDRKIPSVTLGISTGEHLGEPSESVAVGPIPAGLAQLLATLLAIDGGCRVDA